MILCKKLIRRYIFEINYPNLNFLCKGSHDLLNDIFCQYITSPSVIKTIKNH